MYGKKTTAGRNVVRVSARSRYGAPSRQGCVVNGLKKRLHKGSVLRRGCHFSATTPGIYEWRASSTIATEELPNHCIWGMLRFKIGVRSTCFFSEATMLTMAESQWSNRNGRVFAMVVFKWLTHNSWITMVKSQWLNHNGWSQCLRHNGWGIMVYRNGWPQRLTTMVDHDGWSQWLITNGSILMAESQ